MKWFLTYHIGGDVDTLLFDTLDGVFYELSTFFQVAPIQIFELLGRT